MNCNGDNNLFDTRVDAPKIDREGIVIPVGIPPRLVIARGFARPVRGFRIVVKYKKFIGRDLSGGVD